MRVSFLTLDRWALARSKNGVENDKGSHAMSLHVDENTDIALVDDGAVLWSGRLGEFIAANRFDAEGATVIQRDLCSTGMHWGGGGAQPEFCVSLTREPPYTVSFFLVDRAYGGPEEGGWWYGCGEPAHELVQFVRLFHFREDADAYTAKLRRRVEPVVNKGRRPIGSMLSEGQYQVRVSDGFPRAFPATRPHYE